MSFITDTILVCSTEEPCTDNMPDVISGINAFTGPKYKATFSCVSKLRW